jgi:hypothetical protein
MLRLFPTGGVELAGRYFDCRSCEDRGRTPPRKPNYEFQDVFDRRRRVCGYVYASLGANHEASGHGSEPTYNPRRSRTERRRNPKPRSTPATRIYRSDQYWVWRCTCIKSAGRYTSGNAGHASRITRASRAGRSEQSPSFDSARSVKSPPGERGQVSGKGSSSAREPI